MFPDLSKAYDAELRRGLAICRKRRFPFMRNISQIRPTRRKSSLQLGGTVGVRVLTDHARK